MTILVTGATGFLGRRVIQRLSVDHDAVCLVRDPRRGETLRARLVVADLDDPISTYRAFEQAKAGTLVNLASLGFGHASTIVAAAERSGIERAIYISTTAVTTSLPAPTKRVRLDAEATVHQSSVPATVLRPTMIYGAPGDRNIERLLRALARFAAFPLIGADHHHQPVHVEDLAATVVRCLTSSPTRTTYDVPGPEPITFRALASAAAAAVDRRVRFVAVPQRPLLHLLEVAERLHLPTPVSVEQVQRLLEDKAFDWALARADLGHDPRPFVDGVTKEAVDLGLRR